MTSSATDAPNLTSVTNLSKMFRQAFSFNADIGSWDTRYITDMNNMFYFATTFNQEITWNTSSVVDMSFMFGGAWSFNQDISTWDMTCSDKIASNL